MRILWYSLSRWFSPSAEKVEVIDLLPSMSDEELAGFASAPFSFFFEPTPHPQINHYDPVEMARRLSAVSTSGPCRVVAFVSHPAPEPYEAQCAFASQVGHILGVPPEVHRVAVPGRPGSNNGSAKKITRSDGRTQDVDLGPKVDWQRALDAAAAGNGAGEPVPDQAQLLVESYVYPRRGGPRFNPTQRGLLYFAATGEISVIAEEVAEALSVQLVTAQRAILGIANSMGQDGNGRRSPEVVGRVVAQYRWFLSYNEP